MLGVELSAEQLKKLSEISAVQQRKLDELTKDKPKTTDQQELMKFFEPLQAKFKELDKDPPQAGRCGPDAPADSDLPAANT